MARVEDQLKSYGAWVRATQHHTAVEAQPVSEPPEHQVPRRWLVAAAAAVIALVVGVVALNQDDEQEGLVTQPPTDSAFGYEPGWHDLDPGPLSPRVDAAQVWTGEDLYVIGGTAEDGTLLTDGAAYNPATRQWRSLPDIPRREYIDGGTFKAIWTGSKVLLVLRDGAMKWSDPPQSMGLVTAYDPATDAWSTTSSWTEGLDLTVGVADGRVWWNGTELILAEALGVYDPEAGTFRYVFPDEVGMPVDDEAIRWYDPEYHRRSVWTGEELVLFDGSGLGGETLAVDPVEGTGRRVAPRPADPSVSAPVESEEIGAMGDAVWHDSRVVDVDAFGHVGVFDLDADTWTIARLPGATDEPCAPEAAVVGGQVIIDHCGALFNEVDGQWQQVDRASRCCMSTSVSTGDTLLQWSGFDYRSVDDFAFETSFRIWVPGAAGSDTPTTDPPQTQDTIPPATSASPYGPDTSPSTDVSTVNPPCVEFDYGENIDHTPWDERYFNPGRAWYEVGNNATLRPGAAGDASPTPDVVLHTTESEPLADGVAVRDEFPMSEDVGDAVDAALDQDLTVYVQDPGDEWSLAVAAMPDGKILFLGACLDQLYGEDFQALFAGAEDSIGVSFATPLALFIELASGRLDVNDLAPN